MTIKEQSEGRLIGVGLGPGDPELVTLKAVAVLARAQVIAFPEDREGQSRALGIAAAHLGPDSVRLPVRLSMDAGRDGRQGQQRAYDDAAASIRAHVKAGDEVAYLCEGDPLFYGSFIHLLGRMESQVPCAVIPGVSSLGAAAAALWPLARGADVLRVVPALLERAALMTELSGEGPAAIIKIGRHMDKVRAVLGALGRERDALLIGNASLAHETITPLHDLPSGEVPYFSVLLIKARP